MLKSELFPIQKKTIHDIINTFHGNVGHCSNGKIVCLPFGEGKTLTALESSRIISENLRNISGRTKQNHGPVLFVTQRTIVETLINNSVEHYSPSLKALFVTRGETTAQNPDHQTWYNIKDLDVLIVTYETMVSIYNSLVHARSLILAEALKQKISTPAEMSILVQFLHRHNKNPNFNEPLPLERLRRQEAIDNSTTVSTLLFMHRWPVFVMDECHEARTTASMVFKAASQIRASFKIGLSATPFNNSINDVISMFMLAAIPPPPHVFIAVAGLKTGDSSVVGINADDEDDKLALSPLIKRLSSGQASPEVLAKTIFHTLTSKTSRNMSHVAPLPTPEAPYCTIDASSAFSAEDSISQWNSLAQRSEEMLCRAFMECRDLYVVQKSIEEVREHYKPVDIIIHADFATQEERAFYDMVANKTTGKTDIGRILRSRLAAASLYHQKDLFIVFESDDETLIPYGHKAATIQIRTPASSSASISKAEAEPEPKTCTVRTPSKVKIAVSLLATPISRGEKSIVFAHFVHTVLQLRAAIEEAHSVKTFVVLAGASTTQRDDIITACKRYRGPAVLISTKILAQGCDLSFANHTFLLGVWWNDVNEKQSRARTERPDQVRSVFSTQIIMKNTVEEMVWMVSRCKRLINDQVMHGTVTPALVRKTTMLSALNTYAECQQFVSENSSTTDIAGALAQVCDIYVSELPFTEYPPTQTIVSLTGIENAVESYTFVRRAESRSIYPMPSAPSTAKVNSFMRGNYRPKQFHVTRELSMQYQQLIKRPIPRCDRSSRIKIITEDDQIPLK